MFIVLTKKNGESELEISKGVPYLISATSVGGFMGYIENLVNGLMQTRLYYDSL